MAAPLPTQAADTVMNSWVTILQADIMEPPRFSHGLSTASLPALAAWQHGGVGQVKEKRTDHEEENAIFRGRLRERREPYSPQSQHLNVVLATPRPVCGSLCCSFRSSAPPMWPPSIPSRSTFHSAVVHAALCDRRGLSITHILYGEEEAEMDIGEAGAARPGTHTRQAPDRSILRLSALTRFCQAASTCS